MRRAMTTAAVACGLLCAAPAQGATSYCLRGRMADGTYTRAGSLANNELALGTRVYVSPPVMGRRRWVVRDRIGYGTRWDFWSASCAAAVAFGRKEVSVRLGWPVYIARRSSASRLIAKHPPL